MYWQPITFTKKSVACARSGTVNPTCSVPRRPGIPVDWHFPDEVDTPPSLITAWTRYLNETLTQRYILSVQAWALNCCLSSRSALCPRASRREQTEFHLVPFEPRRAFRKEMVYAPERS